MRFPLAMLMAVTITACTSANAPDESETDQPPDTTLTGPQYITLDHDALATAQDALAQRDPDARLDMIDMWNDVALVRFDAQDFKALSQLMHENHKRCGGFAVHDSLDEGLGALRAKDNEGIAPLIAYTIDNAATVNALLPQLSASTLLSTIQQLSG